MEQKDYQANFKSLLKSKKLNANTLFFQLA